MSQSEEHELCFSRHRVDEGGFRLQLTLPLERSKGNLASSLSESLEASHFRADQIAVRSEADSLEFVVDFGVVDGSALSEATQALAIMLAHLGISKDAALRVRYGGTMDASVVSPALAGLGQRAGPLARIAARTGLKHLRRE